MKKIKLLQIISWLDIGGAERQLLSLVSGLDKERYDICVGYFEGKGELKEDETDLWEARIGRLVGVGAKE